ncbi:MAG: hypothetical protein KIT68_11740 [Phycisphaeraceae bacterium]|nr:hypothetical protein [Phycisphaeraceae bacterium]
MARSSPLAGLSEAHRQEIAELYGQCSLTRDDLPYTDEFDSLHKQFGDRTGRQLTKHEFWRALSSIGKMTGLKRKER